MATNNAINSGAPGTAGYVLTSNGPGAQSTYQAVSGAPTWVNVTGTSQAMSGNTNYIANNAGLVTLTLPAVAAVGETCVIVGAGAGGWELAQGAAQTIRFGTSVTTAGIAGKIESQHFSNCLTLTCTTANLVFTAYAAQGDLNVV